MEELEELAEVLSLSGCKGNWGGAGVGVGVGGWYGHEGATADASDSGKEMG